jgi:hypothetical protein
MSNEPGWTPEQHLQAAFDHLTRAARLWAAEARQSLEPVIGRVSDLLRDPRAQAWVRRSAEEDITLACGCECAKIHPDSWVCDVKAVTTIRRRDGARHVDVPVCAPCAAEVMAQQTSYE